MRAAIVAISLARAQPDKQFVQGFRVEYVRRGSRDVEHSEVNIVILFTYDRAPFRLASKAASPGSWYTLYSESHQQQPADKVFCAACAVGGAAPSYSERRAGAQPPRLRFRTGKTRRL
mgnify:FL=1